jgi:hypothetical protein
VRPFPKNWTTQRQRTSRRTTSPKDVDYSAAGLGLADRISNRMRRCPNMPSASTWDGRTAGKWKFDLRGGEG